LTAFQVFQLRPPSGLIAYREFSRAGYDVHVFERDNSPGGNWHYTEETHPNVSVPNKNISVGDFTPSLPPTGAKLPYIEVYQNEKIGEELQRDHRSPKPIWASLSSNVPAVHISG
jgi:cation diffusion facilitator CzcD-associated flavoprotein CzcO